MFRFISNKKTNGVADTETTKWYSAIAYPPITMKPSFFVPSIIGTPRIATTTLLQTGSIPSIKQIETQIEQSWSENFDTKGAKHYRYQIYGQPSKIGAVEVSSVLSYLHIDSTVIQFIVCLASRTLLGNFVWCYFERQFWYNACIQYA